jgi:hypothetical protein
MGILDETILSLQEAADSLPSGMNRGKRLDFSTIWRWVLRGCLAIDGRRVKLEAVRLGGRWLTSREALERFSDALSTPQADQPEPRTPAGRKRDVSSARRKLEKMGIS